MKRIPTWSHAVSAGSDFECRLGSRHGCAFDSPGAVPVAIIFVLMLFLPIASCFAHDSVSEDGLFLRESGQTVALSQTSLRLPALLHIPVALQSTATFDTTPTQPLRTVRPVIDSEGVAVVELYVQSHGDMPELSCHSFVQSGDPSGTPQPVTLTPMQRPQQWRGNCRVLPGTVVILVQITKQTQANAIYGLAIGDAELAVNKLLMSADMDIVDLLNISRVAMRGYPQNTFAKSTFNALSPVRRHIVNRAKHQLLGRSVDQIQKQEKHSFSLAMRNGVDGRGYRLQDYLRDYPDGRFSVKARLEIPKRKRVLFEALPRWAERRAESILRIVLLWQDSDQKVDALQKYMLAYPHGRFAPIVRLEIGRIGDVADAGALAVQMTAGSLR